MKGFVSVFLLCAAVCLSAGDELVLKGGRSVKGEILSLKEGSIEVRMEGTGAELFYPTALVKRVRFSQTERELALLKTPDVTKIPELESVWERRRAYLSLPESDAGEFGLALAELWLEKKTKKHARLALRLIKEVEAEDWNAERRKRGVRLRVRGLANAGKTRKALAEAEALEGISRDDETAVFQAGILDRFAKGKKAWKKVAKLEEAYPKWELMPEMVRKREGLVNDALDAYLFPAVFHADLRYLCARGLWEAVEVYQHLGRERDAFLRAKEIVDFYPDPKFLKKAEKVVKRYGDRS